MIQVKYGSYDALAGIVIYNNLKNNCAKYNITFDELGKNY